MRWVLALLLALMPGTLGAAQERRVVHSVSVSCGGAPPATVAEWWRTSDLIVRARIDTQVSFMHPRRDEVMTAHEATIREVIKSDIRAVGAGASQTILQFGG